MLLVLRCAALPACSARACTAHTHPAASRPACAGRDCARAHRGGAAPHAARLMRGRPWLGCICCMGADGFADICTCAATAAAGPPNPLPPACLVNTTNVSSAAAAPRHTTKQQLHSRPHWSVGGARAVAAAAQVPACRQGRAPDAAGAVPAATGPLRNTCLSWRCLLHLVPLAPGAACGPC